MNKNIDIKNLELFSLDEWKIHQFNLLPDSTTDISPFSCFSVQLCFWAASNRKKGGVEKYVQIIHVQTEAAVINFPEQKLTNNHLDRENSVLKYRISGCCWKMERNRGVTISGGWVFFLFIFPTCDNEKSPYFFTPNCCSLLPLLL